MAAKLGTTRTSRLTPVDGDFQQQYLAAEKAYGAGNYEAAQSICEHLLGQLELHQKGPEQEAMLAWRAFVALLMGHILLYGMNDIQQAQHHYNLVLDSQPQDTLKELAEQGLERCQGELQRQPATTQSEATEAGSAVEQPEASQAFQREASTSAPLPELLRDPFLKADTAINNQANGAELPPFLQHQDPAEAIAKDANRQPSTDLIRDPFLSQEHTIISATNTQATTPTWLKSTTDNDGNSTSKASTQAAKEHFDGKSSNQESVQKSEKKNQTIESQIIEQNVNTSESFIEEEKAESQDAKNSEVNITKQQQNPESNREIEIGANSESKEIEAEATTVDFAIVANQEPNDSNGGFEISKSQSEMILITSEHEDDGNIQDNLPEDLPADIAQDLLKNSIMRVMVPRTGTETQPPQAKKSAIKSINKSVEVPKTNEVLNSKLEVIKAVKDGWDGFRKSPREFVVFTLLIGAFNLGFQAIGSLLVNENNPINIGTIIIIVCSSLGSAIVNLWGLTGMIRGSWMVLNGQRPNFADFIRWDGRAYLRLFIRQLVFGFLFFLLIITGGLLAGGLAIINQIVMFIPMIIIAIFGVILSINQIFLPWIALLEELGPIATIQRGWQVVNPSWLMVALLALFQLLILTVGTLLCFIGLLGAAPLAACISTAAYRQLFKEEADQSVALSNAN
ncbi:hypothetical protein [Prochlorococcus sp. MIT 1303]|uniref:hypothetical protein n=1 Tax=Prochlorococcus sp. MIT 1303 TaxID=1723647 RepID=UPI0007BC6AB7|nr:hypothetical protein [Prochlorococcus sp. MIT 1303]KZR61823.1 hypothetical protein PMIT1303_02024 [Prochlorococcus sp. MIT 1303]